MSPAAQRAQFDFVRLAAEEPSSLYFEQFLRDGFAAWPSAYQARFPGLSMWHGVAGLKQSLRMLAVAPDDWDVLLASRSLSLVKIAAQCMFRHCCNVLTTDLSWPTYQQAIEQRARRADACVAVIPLRDQILYRRWTTHDVASYLASAFIEAGCDGLFLPAVDHLGVRMPIREIVAAIQRHSEIHFCFIDAAQAFCHVSLEESLACADFIVAGSHKWMGAYLPTGIGFYGQRRSQEKVGRRRQLLESANRVDDPLLQFTEQLDGGNLNGRSETVNLTSLFACSGAACDRATSPQGFMNRTVPGIDVARKLIPLIVDDWQPIVPCRAMRSQIVLIEAQNATTRGEPADSVRSRWLEAGRVVSAYPGGRVRMSIGPVTDSGPPE